MNATVARPARRYRCRCEHVFQVFGGGRHRRFYELDDPRWERPVMTRLCSCCERRLPTTRGPLTLEGTARRPDDSALPVTTRLEIRL
jgi:hypothetical protein